MNLKNGWILGILFFILASALTALFVLIGWLIQSKSGYMMGVLGVLGLYIATALFSFLYARRAGEFTKKQRSNISLTYFIANTVLGFLVGLIFKPYPYVFTITIAIVSLIFAAIIYRMIEVEALRYVIAARNMRAAKAKQRAKEMKEKEEKVKKTKANAQKSKISSTTKRGKKKRAKKK